MHNQTLNAWARTLSHLQSPPQYNVWALLSAAAACATQRIAFRRGPIVEYANLMVLLVGDPAARKSVCLTMVKPLVNDIPFIKYGPTSTSGHHQGLLTAMTRDSRSTVDNRSLLDSDEVGEVDWDKAFNHIDVIDRAEDKNALWVLASEASNFFGYGRVEFCAVLNELYDSYDGYSNQLKNDAIVVSRPYLNLIGGATPANIAAMFPDNALEQGIVSRMVLVFGEQVGDDYWPEEIPLDAWVPFRTAMQWIADQEGDMDWTPEFRERFNEFANYSPVLEDIRLIGYAKRRAKHMVKVAMLSALLRQSMTLDVCDLEDAHELLQNAELNMSEALGEFAMSGEALARKRVTKILEESDEPLTASIIQGMAGREVSANEVGVALRTLARLGRVKVAQVKDPAGKMGAAYVWKARRDSVLNVTDLEQTLHVDYPVGGYTDRAVSKVMHTPNNESEPKVTRGNLVDMMKERQKLARKKNEEGGG